VFQVEAVLVATSRTCSNAACDVPPARLLAALTHDDDELSSANSSASDAPAAADVTADDEQDAVVIEVLFVRAVYTTSKLALDVAGVAVLSHPVQTVRLPPLVEVPYLRAAVVTRWQCCGDSNAHWYVCTLTIRH
jgi:hypothetical protein